MSRSAGTFASTRSRNLRNSRARWRGETFADDLSRGDVEGREGRGRAVALVVVAAPLRLPGAHRQEGLGTVQGLDLALFVDTENQGTIRRRQIQADDVADLLHEEGIARQLEGLRAMRLQAEGPPDAMNGRGRVGRSPAPSSEGSNGSRPAASLPASAGPLPRWRHRRFDAARRGGVRRTDRRGPPPHSGDATCPRCPRSPRDERRSPLFSNPSAAAKTIRARRTSPCDVLRRRDSASNSARSSSLKEIVTATLAINRAS